MDRPLPDGKFTCHRSVIGGVLAFATTGSHRARAQSAASDGARARNRPVLLHGSLAIFDTMDRPHLLIPQAVIPIPILQSDRKLEWNLCVDQRGMVH